MDTASTITIDQFNTLSDADCRADLVRCCGATRWVDGMLAARPFTSWGAVYQTACQIWWSLDPADWREAFDHHPQIGGDLAKLREKFASTVAWSAGEQSGVQQANEETLKTLAQGNRDYLAKFGYIFIVCATGKSAAEMSAILQARLPQDPTWEIFIAAEEQRKITFLRLEKWIGMPPQIEREIALVRLCDTDGRFVLQLRDDFDWIAWPNRWAMFGGGVEEGESPRIAALRELAEELTFSPHDNRLFYRSSDVEAPNQADQIKLLYQFDYLLEAEELNEAILQEGQRFDRLTIAEIEQNEKDGHTVAPNHRRMLLR